VAAFVCGAEDGPVREPMTPVVIASANIGCQTHLDGAGRTPVRHWIELVEEAMG